MSLILIAAVDRNWAIGCKNKLIYSVPEDMKRFRSLTSGHTVIMGRKTLESYPGGRPLKNRRNIVISRNYVNREGYDNLVVVRSVKEAVSLLGEEDAYVLGGESIYRSMCPLCDKAVMTLIDAETDGCDAFFPNLDELPDWEREAESEEFISESGLHYRFVDYKKI